MRREFYTRVSLIITIVVVALYLYCCWFSTNTTTTIFFVRHADKAGTSDNLSAIGLARAQELNRILDEAEIDVIYTSQYNRTQQTANPLASGLGLSIQTYDASNISDLATILESSHPGETVLVVGHSNTVPQTLTELGFSLSFSSIPENEYDHMYIAILHSKATDQLMKLEYGADTP